MTVPERSPIEQLQYGQAFAEALHARIRNHFDSLDKEGARQAPLTVGLFGGWGSGKTRHLVCLRDYVYGELKPEITPTLPILFNAWRHEAEDHLIVPLLKTTHYTLERWLDEQRTLPDKAIEGSVEALKKTAAGLKDAALALAAGLKGKLEIPLIGELEIDPGAMLEEDARRAASHDPDQRFKGRFNRRFGRKLNSTSTRIDKLDSIYHDFERHLLDLTNVEGKGTRLNLLFLIDDLDRCLPEKAVQMLESIKLFLDVPGCAFVLALDDEVVERGIAHRYRDYKQEEPAWDSVAHALSPSRYEQYRAERDHQRVGPANPVSGHEYLEKMVHLPLYVPKPNPAEVRGYLRKHFPALFEPLSEKAEERINDVPADNAMKPRRDPAREENAIREKLLELIEHAIPVNPRKLNRLAELYAFKHSVAANNGWKIENQQERLTLLRLCAVQLLSPDLYRFGQHQTGLFARLEQWLKDEGGRALISGHLEQLNRAQRDNYKKHNDDANLRQLERLDEPLLAHLRNAQNQRSRFDPLELLNPKEPCDPALLDYYRLARPLRKAAPTPIHAAPATLANRSLFVDQLLSADPLGWRNALAQEADALHGHVLDDATFTALLEGLMNKPEHINVAWLTQLAPHLTPDQMLRFYRAGNLLGRLNEAVTGDNTP